MSGVIENAQPTVLPVFEDHKDATTKWLRLRLLEDRDWVVVQGLQELWSMQLVSAVCCSEYCSDSTFEVLMPTVCSCCSC